MSSKHVYTAGYSRRMATATLEPFAGYASAQWDPVELEQLAEQYLETYRVVVDQPTDTFAGEKTELEGYERLHRIFTLAAGGEYTGSEWFQVLKWGAKIDARRRDAIAGEHSQPPIA